MTSTSNVEVDWLFAAAYARKLIRKWTGMTPGDPDIDDAAQSVLLRLLADESPALATAAQDTARLRRLAQPVHIRVWHHAWNVCHQRVGGRADRRWAVRTREAISMSPDRTHHAAWEAEIDERYVLLAGVSEYSRRAAGGHLHVTE